MILFILLILHLHKFRNLIKLLNLNDHNSVIIKKFIITYNSKYNFYFSSYFFIFKLFTIAPNIIPDIIF